MNSHLLVHEISDDNDINNAVYVIGFQGSNRLIIF